MQNIVQHAPVNASLFEAANPIFKQVRRVQDAWTTPEILLYEKLWSLGRKHITKSGSRLVKVPTSLLMEMLGLSRPSVFRLMNSMMAMRVLRVVEREQPWTSGARTIEIFSMSAILRTWRSLGWLRVVCNRGKHFVDELGQAIEMIKPELPQLIRRIVEKVQRARKAIANVFLGPTEKTPDASTEETASADQTVQTQESGAAISLDDLRNRLLPKAFVFDDKAPL